MIKRPVHAAVLLLLAITACGGEDEAVGEFNATAPVAEDFSGDGGSVLHRSAADPVTPQTPAGTAQTIDVAASDTGAAAAPVEAGTLPPAGVTLNPMLVRTGTATIQVDSLERGIARVRALAQRLGGIVGGTNISAGTEETRQAVIEVRLPSNRFDAAISGLSPIGRVRAVNVTAEDVGEEFTDVTARVANARRLESRLLDLAGRSAKLEEVLALEKEIARVREEIERYEGRLRYLRTRSSISTLTITLHEPQTVMDNPGEHPIRDALAQAWRNFVGFIAGFITMLGWLIPLGLLLGFGYWVLRYWLPPRGPRPPRDGVGPWGSAPPPPPPPPSPPPSENV